MSHLSRVIVAQLAEYLRDLATDQGRIPFATGQLRKSLTSQVLSDTEAVVGTNLFYARFVHDGTGLYGPMRRKIGPKTKKALYWKGAAHPVKSVKGMPARPFLAQAAEEMARRPLPPLIRKTVGDAVAREIEAQLRKTGLEVKRS
jgi:phage gpG-like protein